MALIYKSRNWNHKYINRKLMIEAEVIYPFPKKVMILQIHYMVSKVDRDMVYIPLHETWYCIECQKKDLILYPSHGSEEDMRQHDYINWYYEQKEKYTKRYLDNERSSSDE